MLDYGIFFEFIPLSEFRGKESTEVISIEHVELNINYAVVISTNAGLECQKILLMHYMSLHSSSRDLV